MKIYIDGKYYSKENGKISVYDHGLLYGDGIFEGIRIYNKKIFKLKEHIERIYMSAKAIGLNVPMTESELSKVVKNTVRENNKKDGYIRLIITRGIGDLGINPVSCTRPSVIIIVDDIALYPEEMYEKGIRIITASLRRISADALDPRIKSLNYLNNIMAKMEALNAGCEEAVMLNREGYVTECTGDNVFIIKNRKLMTPDSKSGALNGITKSTVLNIGPKAGLIAEEMSITQYDLYSADECFLTGTGAEIIPVIEIDGRIVGTGLPGKHTKKLFNLFKKEVYSN